MDVFRFFCWNSSRLSSFFVLENKFGYNKKTMEEFEYIIKKIENSNIEKNHFEYVYIENFLSEKHFKMLLEDRQIRIPSFSKIEELIEYLENNGYEAQYFPGCTIDKKEYIEWFYDRTKQSDAMYLTSDFGMTYKIIKYVNKDVENIVKFFNSDKFIQTLMKKFGKTGTIDKDAGVQKYLSGYEISPHPDVRRKCVTYMININHMGEEEADIYTKFMKLKKPYDKLYDFWETNKDYERNAVPWSWCETFLEQKKNNSIFIFPPSNSSIHAVKLDYNCLEKQRTQIYGNIWYRNMEHLHFTSVDKMVQILKGDNR